MNLKANERSRKLTKLNLIVKDSEIIQKKDHTNDSTSQINIKAVLASYYIGSSGKDI